MTNVNQPKRRDKDPCMSHNTTRIESRKKTNCIGENIKNTHGHILCIATFHLKITTSDNNVITYSIIH